jgi:hypothetical protein
MRVMVVAALVAAAMMVSGCVSEPAAPAAEPEEPEPVEPRYWATVAIIDTGINPYHVAFRDENATMHPSTYLPGYPEEAEALVLDFSKGPNSAQAAHDRDAEAWSKVVPGNLYWIPGTKIVGLYVAESGDGFSTGHGTMTASRAAANNHSLCTECRIVAVQGFTGAAVTWASKQPWIDAQSNSWSPIVVFQQADPAQEAGLADAFAAAAKRHLVFGSAGNGVMGKLGVLGHPSFTRSTSGPPGVISVGGHDNGEVVLWSGSWPHVVADACNNWAAVGSSLDQYSGSAGGGTSSASPYAAGAAARIILEARRVLGDDGTQGIKDGVVARGNATASGPLSDGKLTLQEVKDILFRTAVARPMKTAHDGNSCREAVPYNTYPVEWSAIPAEIPAYYFIGYGQMSIHSVAAALKVVAGEMPLPARSDVALWHQANEAQREAYHDLPH